MVALLILLAIGLPWLGALLVWLVGERPALHHGVAMFFSVISGIAGVGLLFFNGPQPVVLMRLGGVFGDVSFVADGLGVFLAAVATVIGCLAVIFSVDYMHGEQQL